MTTTPTLFKDGFPVAQPFASASILYHSGEWFCWGKRLATDELAKRTGVPLTELFRWESERARHEECRHQYGMSEGEYERWLPIYQQYQRTEESDE